MEQSIRATRTPKRRSPKSFGKGRICASRGCDTIVSRYNKSDHCNRHRPVKFPRVRGAYS